MPLDVTQLSQSLANTVQFKIEIPLIIVKDLTQHLETIRILICQWTLITAWLPLYHLFTGFVAKLAMSHVLQSNKNKTNRGRCKCLSVSFD